MANEISSIATLRPLSSIATNSRQVATTDVASLPDDGGQTLPGDGKEQPSQAANTAEVRQAVELADVVAGERIVVAVDGGLRACRRAGEFSCRPRYGSMRKITQGSRP